MVQAIIFRERRLNVFFFGYRENIFQEDYTQPWRYSEAHSEHCQKSKMKLFTKIVNGQKCHLRCLDVWQTS